jgi:broad specificity phosphatase PhoE
MGNMFEIPAGTFTLVDPVDIAEVAAEALVKQNFTGHSFQYVVSDISGTDEIAALIGKALGKPDMKWLKFGTEDFRQTLRGYGFAEGAAADYVEMFETLDSGRLFDDFFAGGHQASGTSIEQFAQRFAEIYNA